MAGPFKSILCGVDGNPASTEAARQAITLAGDGAEIHFIAVYTTFELGPDYHKDALEKSLEQAALLASEAGVTATTDMREAKYAIDVLLPESREHDLTVLGTHGKSRAVGIMFGSTATEAAHGSERPLLISREAPTGSPFPRSIVFASDGTAASGAAAGAAASIAGAFGATVEVINVEDGDADSTELERQAAEIASAAGAEPSVDHRDGNVAKEIVEAAEGRAASLVVCGRRGLKGIKSLGSVSERVVSAAHCSVLLVPDGVGG